MERPRRERDRLPGGGARRVAEVDGDRVAAVERELHLGEVARVRSRLSGCTRSTWSVVTGLSRSMRIFSPVDRGVVTDQPRGVDVAVERTRPAVLLPVGDAVAVARGAHLGVRRLHDGVRVDPGVGEHVEAGIALVGGERGLVGAFGRALDVADQPPASTAFAVRVGDHEHRTSLRDLAAQPGSIARVRAGVEDDVPVVERAQRRRDPRALRRRPTTTSGAPASSVRTIDGAFFTGNTLTGGGSAAFGGSASAISSVLRVVQTAGRGRCRSRRRAPSPVGTDGLVSKSHAGTARDQVEAVGLEVGAVDDVAHAHESARSVRSPTARARLPAAGGRAR